jgi:hypothetical protein
VNTSPLFLWLVFTPFVAHRARLRRAAGRQSIQDRCGIKAMSLPLRLFDEPSLWIMETWL